MCVFLFPCPFPCAEPEFEFETAPEGVIPSRRADSPMMRDRAAMSEVSRSDGSGVEGVVVSLSLS